jgi:2-polyprenyl-6-methoxyphenol hydroxylase-like FAD-dependent oxidoreductase
VSIEQTTDGVRALAADGTVEEGDLLVGADGIRSVVRHAVAPAEPRSAGYTVWRGVSSIAVEPGRLTESWGTGARFGLVDIGSRTSWFATANTDEAKADSPSERKAELMQRFAGWHAPIATAIETTPDSAILRTDMYFLESLKQWSEGRIVLVGDAAHATTPGVGQGAAQAIEDAVVLADQLSRHGELAKALDAYESVRRPRAELTLKPSRRADRAGQLTNPLGRRLRNHLVRHTPARVQLRQLGPLVHHRLR